MNKEVEVNNKRHARIRIWAFAFEWHQLSDPHLISESYFSLFFCSTTPSVHFQGKPFKIIVIQVYAPTSNAEEAEVKWFYEDIQDPPSIKDVLFIIGGWNAKVGSQETPNRQIWPWSTE